MSLMQRIQVLDWLSKTQQEKHDQISALQGLRLSSMAESRIKKGGVTRSAIKNTLKRGVDPTAKAKAALAKLSPEQLAALAKML